MSISPVKPTVTDTSPLANLEKLQDQLPAHLARSDLAELAVLMRYAEAGAWAFAIFNTVPVRDEVATALRALLSPLPVYDATLSHEQSNPMDFLEQLQLKQDRAVVFFFDLEQTQGAIWQHLELQRENLAAQPISLIFWINKQSWREGVRQAPNFWSQRGGVFDFTIESGQTVAEIRGAWAGEPVRLDSPEDWERQMRLFSGLLREYEADEATAPTTEAELHGKIAYLFRFADQPEQARHHLEQQLKLAEESGDTRQQVQALNNVGQIIQMQQGRMAALAWYERALKLADEDPHSRANGLQNIAGVLAWEGESGEAQQMLQETLTLFRELGDRLGEANTLQAMGSLKLAEEKENAAMPLFDSLSDNVFDSVDTKLAQSSRLGQS